MADMISLEAGVRIGRLLDADPPHSRASPHTPTAAALVLYALVVAGLHAREWSGFLAAPAVVSPGGTREPEEELIMQSDRNAIVRVRELGVASAAAAAALVLTQHAAAQNAVEWRTADGGNGHWYAAIDAPTGDAAIALATSLGGHLATVSSAAENSHLRGIYAATGKQWAWLGLRQQKGQATPGAGWYWITGEPLAFRNWSDHNGAFPTGAPDDSPCAQPPWGVENDQANQGVMQFDGRWDDLETGQPSCGSPKWNNTALVEWDADCNGDGIVDFGQIRNGEFPDLNSNNVPDCCDQGWPCGANLLVNGSFESGPEQACGWICLSAGSQILPGWTVTLNSIDRQRTAPPECQPEGWLAADGQFSVDLNGCSVGGRIEQSIPTIVGRRYAIALELTVNAGWPRGDLRIHAGTQSFDFTALRVKKPLQPWSRKIVEFTATAPTTVIAFESLNRESPTQWAGPVIDDARVVLRPELPCPGDVTGDRAVNGVDLAAVLGTWNTAGSGQFDTDINDDGVVNGADLAILLGAWGTCP